MTTKEIAVVGDRATAEVDFESETLTIHDVHHELRNGVWAAVVGESMQPPLEPCDPVQMVVRELEAFLQATKTRTLPSAGPVESGVNLAVLIEAIYESAARREPVRIESKLEAVTKP